jgi:hypothetical protein
MLLEYLLRFIYTPEYCTVRRLKNGTVAQSRDPENPEHCHHVHLRVLLGRVDPLLALGQALSQSLGS